MKLFESEPVKNRFTHLTPLQRTRTLTAFYVTILPFCFFAKYAERKYFQDPLDKHLNKSKLFGGRKLYPDTWTGALW